MRAAALLLAAAAGLCLLPSAAGVAPQIDVSVVYGGPTYDAFPSAAVLKNGELVVTFRSGAGHITLDGKIQLARSRDGGSTWSTAVAYDDPDLDDRANLGLVRLRNGTLLLPFFKHDGRLPVGSFVIRSRNGGRTWTAPKALRVPQQDWLAVYGRAIEANRTTLVLPVYGRRTTDTDSPPLYSSAFLLESIDGGASWRMRGLVGRTFNEATIVRTGKGGLLAVVRGGYVSGFNNVYTTRSTSGGRRWTPPAPLFEGAVSPDLIRLKGGRLLLCVSDRDETPGVRCHTSADGRTWSSGTMIYEQPGPNRDLGYPSSVQLRDGRVFTAFYTPRGDILAATYSVASID